MSVKQFVILVIALSVLAGCGRNSWWGRDNADRTGVAALKKGVAALEKGNYADSVIWLQRALPHITVNDERAIVLNCLGISYQKLGRQQNAIQAFEEACTANPAAFDPVYNLGIAFLENGNDDKAIACFEKACLLSGQSAVPSGAQANKYLPPGRPDIDTRALEFLAVVYCRKQQWDDARRVLTEANRQNSPRILTTLALVELQAANTNQALEYLQKALEQDAHYAPAIYNMGMINRQWPGKQSQVLPLLNEYVRLQPSGPYSDQARSIIKEITPASIPPKKEPASAAEKTGRIHAKETKTSKALPAADEKSPKPAPQKETPAVFQPAPPPSFEELMQVAKKLEQQGRREAAFNNYLRIALAAERANKSSVQNQALRHAVSLSDGNPQAAYDLGVYYAERNKKDDALSYYKTAIDQNTNQYVASMALARLSLEKGDYDAAIVCFKKADTIKPNDPDALWLLADLYDQRLGMTNAAVLSYEQFVKRFANDGRVTIAISRLKTIKPEIKTENVPDDKGKRSFWQRMRQAPATDSSGQ
jgi:tetratricopeptide (TPR) repeat protein